MSPSFKGFSRCSNLPVSEAMVTGVFLCRSVLDRWEGEFAVHAQENPQINEKKKINKGKLKWGKMGPLYHHTTLVALPICHLYLLCYSFPNAFSSPAPPILSPTIGTGLMLRGWTCSLILERPQPWNLCLREAFLLTRLIKRNKTFTACSPQLSTRPSATSAAWALSVNPVHREAMVFK